MPKVTLQFNLPEEQTEFENAVNAGKFKSAMWDFEQQLRSWIKYHHSFEDANDALQKIREFYFQCLNDHNVSTD